MVIGEPNEELLLRRWRAGDRGAGDSLVRLCRPVLRAFFRRRTSENIDELMQRTLVACIQSIARFQGRSTFRGFLLGIAHKQFLMSLRSKRIREIPVLLPAGDSDCPGQLLAAKEDMRNLTAALRDTSPPFRRVIEMFYWDDLSVEEIARALELPVGTVKSRLVRGRSMLKARLLEASNCGNGTIRRAPDGAGHLRLVQNPSLIPQTRSGLRPPAILREPTTPFALRVARRAQGHEHFSNALGES